LPKQSRLQWFAWQSTHRAKCSVAEKKKADSMASIQMVGFVVRCQGRPPESNYKAISMKYTNWQRLLTTYKTPPIATLIADTRRAKL